MTCEQLNGHLRAVSDRSLAPDIRQSHVEALVKLCNTGEIRDVTPGFDAEFYVLLFRVLQLAFDESQQLASEPETPSDNPLPTDGNCRRVSSSVRLPVSVSVFRPGNATVSSLICQEQWHQRPCDAVLATVSSTIAKHCTAC